MLLCLKSCGSFGVGADSVEPDVGDGMTAGGADIREKVGQDVRVSEVKVVDFVRTSGYASTYVASEVTAAVDRNRWRTDTLSRHVQKRPTWSRAVVVLHRYSRTGCGGRVGVAHLHTVHLYNGPNKTGCDKLL